MVTNSELKLEFASSPLPPTHFPAQVTLMTCSVWLADGERNPRQAVIGCDHPSSCHDGGPCPGVGTLPGMQSLTVGLFLKRVFYLM